MVDRMGMIQRDWYDYFAGAGRTIEAGEVQAGAGLEGGGFVQEGVELSIAPNGVTDTMLRNSAAMSVIGRYADSSGDPADIPATDNDRALQRIGDELVFTLIKAKAFTVGTAPDAGDYPAGTIIWVSDEAGGATLAVSDATDWLRVSDGAVIS
jgi:hypothetical protein